MAITSSRFRLLMLAAAAVLVTAGLAVRGSPAGAGAVGQHAGTALYASMVYVGVLFLWPRRSPWAAGAMAWAWCWAVEFLQLTGVPADLAARSTAARLVLGAHFDPVDLIWYPAGIVPLVAAHHLVNRSRRRSSAD